MNPNWNRWTTCGLLALGLGSGCGDDGSTPGDGSSGATESSTGASTSGTSASTTASGSSTPGTTIGEDTDPTSPTGETDSTMGTEETGPPPNSPPFVINVNLPAYGLPAPTEFRFSPSLFIAVATDPELDPLSLVADRGTTVLSNPYTITPDEGAIVTLAPTGMFDEFEFTIEDDEGGQASASGFPISLPGVRLPIEPPDLAIRCPAGSTYCGHEVVNVGDVNGDGREDLALGWPEYDTDAELGRVYVIFGRENIATPIDLEDIDAGSGGFYIEGPAELEGFGFAVGGVGDVNGDGFDDVAALNADAYIIYGDASPTSTTASQAVSEGRGFRVSRTTPFGDFYADIDGIGDLNGDGNDDFVIGASASTGGPRHGHAYVVWGGDLGGTIPQTSLESGANGIWFRDDLPEVNVFSAEVTVAGLGDLDGDGLGDFGLTRSPNSGPIQGYVAFGRATGGIVELSSFSEGVDGVTFGTDETGNVESIAGIPNFGGPGIHGVAIGQSDHSAGDGRVVVMTDFTTNFNLDVDGIHLEGAECRTGVDLANAGDANGDGRGDVLVAQVCIPDLDADGLRAIVAYGTDTPSVQLSRVEEGVIGHVIDYPRSEVDDEYGRAGVERMGRIDFNGDGEDETFLADPRRGVVHLVLPPILD